MLPALLQSGNREEVEPMIILTDFLLSVGASIVASIISYYICKWLDGRRKGK